MEVQGLIKELIFLVCSVSAVLLGLLVVLFRNPIYSSISLIASFIPVAVIFLLLHAHFVAVIEVLVYAGAIMVLFTFVIMMVDLKKEEYALSRGKFYRLMSLLLVLLFFVLVPLIGFNSLVRGELSLLSVGVEDVEGLESFGSTRSIGEFIFGDVDTGSVSGALESSVSSVAIVSFELASILIIVAIVGVFVLARGYGRGGGI